MARSNHESASKTGGKTTGKSSKLVKEVVRGKSSSSASPKKAPASSKMNDRISDAESGAEEDEHEPKRAPKSEKSSEKKKRSSSSSSSSSEKKKRISKSAGGVKKASSSSEKKKRVRKPKEPKEPKERKIRVKEVDAFDAESLEGTGNQLSAMASEELAYDNPLLFTGTKDPVYQEKVNKVRLAISSNPSALLPATAGIMRIVKPLLKKHSLAFTEIVKEAKGDKYNEKKHAVNLRASKSFKYGLNVYLVNMALDAAKKSGTCAVIGQKKCLSAPSFIGAVNINDKYNEICDVPALMEKWRLSHVPPKPRVKASRPKKATPAN